MSEGEIYSGTPEDAIANVEAILKAIKGNAGNWNTYAETLFGLTLYLGLPGTAVAEKDKAHVADLRAASLQLFKIVHDLRLEGATHVISGIPPRFAKDFEKAFAVQAEKAEEEARTARTTEAMAGLLLTFIRTGQLTVEEARAHLAGAPLPADCGKRPIVMAPPTPGEVVSMTPEKSEEIRRQAGRIVALGAGATPEEIIAALEGRDL